MITVGNVQAGTGCAPCPPDAKGTHTLGAVLGLKATAPTATLDLTHLIGTVRDQGAPGTCVGFGLTRAVRQCALQSGHPDLAELSALHAYKQARAILRILNEPLDGATTDGGLRGMQAGGYLLDSEMPYRPADRWGGNKLGKGQSGLRRAGVKSHRLLELPGPSLKEVIKTGLCSGKGLVGGWYVNDSFVLWQPTSGPFAGLTGPGKEGHCMSVLDYPKGLPRIVSSWGPNVGDGGVWTVTWEFLMEAMSLWVVDFVPVS